MIEKTRMKIELVHEIQENGSKTSIHYKGTCSPGELDSGILSMVNALIDARNKERKRFGLSRTGVEVTESPDNNGDVDYSDYEKR